jgi:hypothetical protein
MSEQEEVEELATVFDALDDDDFEGRAGREQATLAGKCAIALLGDPRTVSAVILADKVIKSGRLDEENPCPVLLAVPW